MAACVAVISDTNQLLYLQTAECFDPIFYHFKVHAALDVIEDKLAKRAAYSSNSLEQTDQYLGLLYPMEDHRLYGYVTNTQIKVSRILVYA
ncbi:Trafficking protein particle complex subunit 2 protein [Paragonimus heterotremus]|uniref:Trafficking protein particle complex subunit 2 protein n=1 Tax=Paragonimus heterotremus TaxID=100268 RepID=A0A8J4SIA1_9TREM|nr:Trafficking protein particle complex subunit 2 protein [Paragonimus heterotremus]